MASQSQTVSLYHRKLRESQSITHSIYGHFSSDNAQEFVLVKGTILELIQLDTTSPLGATFNTICTHDTFSIIRDIKVFTFNDHNRDYIALGTDSGIFTILRFNKQLSDFEPIVSEMYGRSGIRRAISGQYIACDPLGRSVLISGLEKSKIAYGLNSFLQQNETNVNAPPTRIYNVTSGVELNSNGNVTFDVVGLYTEKYSNPLFASIESNYNEVIATNITNNSIINSDGNSGVNINLVNTVNKFKPKNMCKYLTLYEHEVNAGNMNKLIKIATVPIPSSAHRIIPIPITHIYPGGCIVLCENCLYYYPICNAQAVYSATAATQSGMTPSTCSSQETLTVIEGIRCDYPIRMSNQPKDVIINTFSAFLLTTKKLHHLFIFLQTECGDIFKVNLTTILQQNKHKNVVKNIQQQLQHQQQQQQQQQQQSHSNLNETNTTNTSNYNISAELSALGIVNDITEIKCVYFDTLPPANNIHVTAKGQLFLSSESTNSALYTMKARDVLPTDSSYAFTTSLLYKKIHPNQNNLNGNNNNNNNDEQNEFESNQIVSLQQDKNCEFFSQFQTQHHHPTNIKTLLDYIHPDILTSTMIFIPTPLIRCSYLVDLTSLSTIRTATISTSITTPQNSPNSPSNPLNTPMGTLITADSTNTLSLYTSHGSSSRSFIALNKFGILYQVLANSPLENTPINLFTAITNFFNPQHSLLCLAFPNSTLFMAFGDDGLNDFSHTHFISDQFTIKFGSIIDTDNTNIQPDIGLVFNANNSIYLNQTALVQITPKRINCILNSNTGHINQDSDENLQNSLQLISNSFTSWKSGVHDISCADITNNYIIVCTSSKIHILKLSFNTLTVVCEYETGSMLTQINAYHASLEYSSANNTSLFFSTYGMDGYLRFYTLIHEEGKFSLRECDIQYIGKSSPSSTLITTTNIDNNQNNFLYCVHVILQDYLYQYTLSKSGQIVTTDPIKQYVGGNKYSQMKLCLGKNGKSGSNNSISSNNSNNNNNNNNQSDDIILCSTNRTPQIFRENNWLQLNIIKPRSSTDDIAIIEDEMDNEEDPNGVDYISLRQKELTEESGQNGQNGCENNNFEKYVKNYHQKYQKRQNTHNINDMQQYGVLYNAIYLNSPSGELIIGNCDSELLICRSSASHGVVSSTLNPSRFTKYAINPEDGTPIDNTVQSYSGDTSFLSTTIVQPVTYTCRNLIHVDIPDLCSQYHLQHTPLYIQSASNDVTTGGGSAMGDEDGNNTDKKMTLPYEDPIDIIDNGIAKVAKQSGNILISVEGDNNIMGSAENEELYNSFLSQQYTSLVSTNTNFSYDYTTKYPISSNTHNFTGGNGYEYHCGYFQGNNYQGCVRLLNPISLQTFHCIPTPPNMIITCSTIAVMNDYTVLVVGGYRNRPLDYDLNLKINQNIDQSDPNVRKSAKEQAQMCVTTGMLATYELYYSPESKSWAVSLLHVTNTPHRVSAVSKLHYNQSILIGQSDELCVYQLGKKQLLFKSKMSLNRGLITTITTTMQYNVLDHTDAVNTIIYVGFSGQGYSMVRLSMNKVHILVQNNQNNPNNQTSPTIRYIWNLLTNNVDSRYALSMTCVQGGFISGDRFGNVALYGLNNDDIITLIKDPTGYPSSTTSNDPNNSNTTAPNLNTTIVNATSTSFGNYYYQNYNSPSQQNDQNNSISNPNFIRLENFAEIHLSSPITSLFTINLPNYNTQDNGNNGIITPQTQQCVLYTTLNGQIGIFKPISSPLENEILQKCLLYAYNQLSITGVVIRKYLGYWNPVLNVIDGGIVLEWLNKVKRIHYFQQHSQHSQHNNNTNTLQQNNDQNKNVYNYNTKYSTNQHYQHLLTIANEYCSNVGNSNVLLDLIQMVQFIDNNSIR